MNKYKSMNFYDFSFGGRKLSEFGGYIGSTDGGLKTFSVLPSRTYTTEKPLKSDVTTVYDSSLDPRVFSVPVVFEEITDGLIRKLASWLNSPIDKKFYFIDDDVYINARLDSNAFDMTSLSGIDGELEIKFICYNPYYYSMQEVNKVFSNINNHQYNTTILNNGVEVFPTITINTTGSVTITCSNSDGSFATCTVSNITSGFIINGLKREVTTLSGANMYSSFSGEFPSLKNGDTKITIKNNNNTNFTNMSVKYVEKYL